VQNRTNSVATRDKQNYLPIVVHSHLRWDFVWQRPQQILSRLAADHPIAFIEEPIWGETDAALQITEPYENLTRVIPMLPRSCEHDTDAQCAAMLPLLQQALHDRNFFNEPLIHWFYNPMVAPFFLGKWDTAAVVYDCMDELAKFRFAPADLPDRERVLLATADVVFTGGYQLFTAKSRHHRNVHFYGCGVEVEHFAKARDSQTAIATDIAGLPRPVLGYFGVIDERLDYELIERLAERFSHGSIVMVGPVVKMDASALPKRSNIHWMGQRDYQQLPAYVKAFDVCLMPFALNEATENINPTKTLEYMAAGKPIVSTAVRDVVRNFAPVVQVAQTHDEFAALAEKAFTAPQAEALARGIERANAASWQAIVEAIRGLMLSAVRAHERPPMEPTVERRTA
jgi:glycosyltransferase involved in cell wall biosynthesis